MKKSLAFFLVVFCFMASFAFSEETSGLQNHSEVKPSKPPQDLHLKDKKKVVVGIFLSSITNFSLSKRTADLGFYVWWRSPYSDYNPVEHTEIVNSPDYKKWRRHFLFNICSLRLCVWSHTYFHPLSQISCLCTKNA